MDNYGCQPGNGRGGSLAIRFRDARRPVRIARSRAGSRLRPSRDTGAKFGTIRDNSGQSGRKTGQNRTKRDKAGRKWDSLGAKSNLGLSGHGLARIGTDFGHSVSASIRVHLCSSVAESVLDFVWRRPDLERSSEDKPQSSRGFLPFRHHPPMRWQRRHAR